MKLLELERLGAPGVIGLGLLVLALSFYVGTVAPTLDELATQQAEQVRLRAALASTAAAAIAGGPGQMASGRLPGFSAAPELLKQLHQLARWPHSSTSHAPQRQGLWKTVIWL
jgi:hypothetical protein